MLPSHNLDAIAREVAAGDYRREVELVDYLMAEVAQPLVALHMRRPHLKRHRDDFLAEARLAVVKYARRYSPEKGANVRTFVRSCVTLELRKYARTLMARNGASLGSRGYLDLDDPAFRPVQSWTARRRDGSGDTVADATADEREGDRAGYFAKVRRVVKLYLSRLTLEERQVAMLLFGIHERRTSEDKWALAQAAQSKPLGMDRIAKELGRDETEVEAIRDRAFDKIRAAVKSLATSRISRVPGKISEPEMTAAALNAWLFQYLTEA